MKTWQHVSEQIWRAWWRRKSKQFLWHWIMNVELTAYSSAVHILGRLWTLGLSNLLVRLHKWSCHTRKHLAEKLYFNTVWAHDSLYFELVCEPASQEDYQQSSYRDAHISSSEHVHPPKVDLSAWNRRPAPFRYSWTDHKCSLEVRFAFFSTLSIG